MNSSRGRYKRVRSFIRTEKKWISYLSGSKSALLPNATTVPEKDIPAVPITVSSQLTIA
ncbi:hypothetical protein BDV37DRAFT_257761 [Aspergillus pseudonomiae]|uniref:Uncharacterized protein n=1 Tax=Aspergillus pseudonomiae TaxID=1506151 RepID=A0A5N7D1U2_9EURO|nr:uncharacterized protein BDV37DRAFT_257761 [Aspergillus pseudonomiae]KAE8400391.1 hypothetical protein BDV37DRAFT_257761 [Aspergillus pseudonomiae]